MIFADAFYWLALVNDKDIAHDRAVQFASSITGSTLTTEWVLAEVCDGLSTVRRRHHVNGLRLLWQSDSKLLIAPADHDGFERGLELYLSRPDKEWSLTGCISFVVMQDHGVTEALTGDHHFTQAGFSALLA
jgi:predicted nucleic acid-binding protein